MSELGRGIINATSIDGVPLWVAGDPRLWIAWTHQSIYSGHLLGFCWVL